VRVKSVVLKVNGRPVEADLDLRESVFHATRCRHRKLPIRIEDVL
jgi:hypothetical protein